MGACIYCGDNTKKDICKPCGDVIDEVAERCWHAFVQAGGPYGYSSTYEKGFRDGVKWMSNGLRDVVKRIMK